MGRQGSTSENTPQTSPGPSEEKTTELLVKGFLRNFLVEPLDRESCIKLSEVIKHRFQEEKAIAFITPTELLMKQVGQIALLSFGRYINWLAASSYELIRLSFLNDGAVFDAIFPDLLIVYHGFDSSPNKLTPGNVSQLCMSRAMRNKPTLVLEKYDDKEVTAVIPQSVPVALSARLDPSPKAKKESQGAARLNLSNNGSGLSWDLPGLPPLVIN